MNNSEPVVTFPWEVVVKVFRTQVQMALVNEKGMSLQQANKYLDFIKDNPQPEVLAMIPQIVADNYRSTTTFVKQLVDEFNAELSVYTTTNPDIKKVLIPARDLHSDALEWDTTTRSFEGWVEMMKKFFYHECHQAIDTAGRLKNLADVIFKQDLQPYFNEYCGAEPRDREQLLIMRAILDEQIAAVENKQP